LPVTKPGLVEMTPMAEFSYATTVFFTPYPSALSASTMTMSPLEVGAEGNISA